MCDDGILFWSLGIPNSNATPRVVFRVYPIFRVLKAATLLFFCVPGDKMWVKMPQTSSQREREVYRATADKTLEKKRRERDARFVHIVLRRIYIYI